MSADEKDNIQKNVLEIQTLVNMIQPVSQPIYRYSITNIHSANITKIIQQSRHLSHHDLLAFYDLFL